MLGKMPSTARTMAERDQAEAVARATIEAGGTWGAAAEAITDMGLPSVNQRTLRLWAQENGWIHLKSSQMPESTLTALRESRTPGTDSFKKRIEKLHGWTPEERQEAAKEVGEAALELVRQAVILANRVGEVAVQESFDGKISQIVVVRGQDVEAVAKSAAQMFDKADRLGGIPADVSSQLNGLAGQIGQAVGFTALDRILAASSNMLGLYDGALPATAIEAMKSEPLPVEAKIKEPETLSLIKSESLA